jgi:hypothetical protein
VFTNKRREFLSGLVANLGQLMIGAGALEQVFGRSPKWTRIIFVSIIALILLGIAFLIHPEE